MTKLNIVVAGAGKVGYTVAEQLEAEGHDVTLIDTNEDKLSRASDAMDVQTIAGNCASIHMLEEAGVERCDVYIAASGVDEVNIVSCLAAQKLGAKHTIGRIRNPIYYFDERDADFLQQQVEISINPDFEAADEIFRVLQFPTAERVDTFAQSHLDMVTYHVPKSSTLVNLPLNRLRLRMNEDILICAVQNGEEVVIPNGSYTIRADDRITVLGTQPDLKNFFTQVGAFQHPVRYVLIMGGSRIAVYLAKKLLLAGIHVTLIECNSTRANELSEALRGCDIILGDGTRRDILSEANFEDQDAFVALTNYDENNILTSLFVSSQTGMKVISKVSENHFLDLLGDINLDSVICPKELAGQQITAYIRALQNSLESSSVETMYRLADGQVEALEFAVRKGAAVTRGPLSELNIKPGILVAFLIRNYRSFIATGHSVIQDGDRAIVITTRKGLNDIDEILDSHVPAP